MHAKRSGPPPATRGSDERIINIEATDANGHAVIPGGIEVWKNLFVTHPHGKYDGKLTKAAVGWKDADDVIEALFALCRKAVENEPLKIFMAVSDLDRNRQKVLE